MSEEGIRLHAYNDATGQRVTCVPHGNLTIAVGVNLENGIDEEEAQWLTAHRIAKTDKSLSAYDWYTTMDDIRGSVFLDVGYNAGVSGLLHFTTAIHFAASKSWPQCVNALMQSKAAEELPNRYKRLGEILLSGDP